VVLAILMVFAFGTVVYRLVQLQVLWRDRLRAAAKDNTRRVIAREPRRGEIRDIRGNLLATSVYVKTVCADPFFAGTNQLQIARALAPLLQTNEAFVFERLLPRVIRLDTNNQPVIDRHVVLKRRVRLEDWDKIEQALTNLSFGVDESKLKPKEKLYFSRVRHRAIFFEEDQLRLYPSSNLAAHVVGYLGTVTKATPAGEVNETVGQTGIERLLDKRLRGVRGWRRMEIDKSRREMVNFRQEDVAPQAGQHVVLTIDAGLQHIVETELAKGWTNNRPESISAIVVRPKTGEILAMGCYPSYDANQPGASAPENLRNRMIRDCIEPGSTFKIVVVSGALNDHLITLNDIYDCENGAFRHGKRLLRDHHAYGLLSVEEVIAKSSNIGAAKIGMKMGPERLFHYVKQFGFGDHTGITLPGEQGGLVNSLKRWNEYSITSVPMGHEISTTQLQMVMAMSAIANGGKLMRPVIVDHLVDEQNRVLVKVPPQPVRQVVSPEAARLMVQALKRVTTTNGTAKKAALEDHLVAGKTGTAQKSGEGGVGYISGKFLASFIGFFPADDAELCISVWLDDPSIGGHQGGAVAAPVFHEIATRAANHLNMAPSVRPEPREVASQGPRILATGTPGNLLDRSTPAH
jgi:cell division protein FtsI/penicillin-binding protein 2